MPHTQKAHLSNLAAFLFWLLLRVPCDDGVAHAREPPPRHKRVLVVFPVVAEMICECNPVIHSEDRALPRDARHSTHSKYCQSGLTARQQRQPCRQLIAPRPVLVHVGLCTGVVVGRTVREVGAEVEELEGAEETRGHPEG